MMVRHGPESKSRSGCAACKDAGQRPARLCGSQRLEPARRVRIASRALKRAGASANRPQAWMGGGTEPIGGIGSR
ncbi:MAG: hypothetical protein D6725_10425 [Planctomycetota bacterium]|nr:MAG: hypothetical protein D6725_10425 [Planctomycetota bacterium]